MHIILQPLINGILLGGIYAIMASGLALIFGVTRVLQVAHSALVVAGCYLTFWLTKSYGIDPFLTKLAPYLSITRLDEIQTLICTASVK